MPIGDAKVLHDSIRKILRDGYEAVGSTLRITWLLPCQVAL
jgi:hypothetical protein